MATEYKPPVPELNDDVLWYPEPGAEPQAAKVTRVGILTITVNILDPATYNLRIRDGVRHVSDPALARLSEEVRQQGVWDWTPRMKRLIELESLSGAPARKK